MKKILFGIVSLVLLLSVIPVYAENSSVKIGDKLILTGGYEAVCIGFNKGLPIYQADLSTPVYLPDLKTKIDTSWKLDKDGTFKNGANSFNSYVYNEFVNVTDNNLKSLSWNPEVYVGKTKSTVKQVKPKLLSVDPLNSNYQNNTLEWDYGNGIIRRLRIIEGIQQEYYIVNSKVSGDIEIKSNTIKNGIEPQKATAFGMNNNSVEMTIDNHNLKITNETLSQSNYPITIDPDVTFTTSSSDGYLWSTDAVYANARTMVNAESIDNTSTFSYVGNDFITGTYQTPRGYVYFNTASLSGYVITAANLNIYASILGDTNNESIQVQSGMATYPHDPLVVGDYDLTNYVADTNCGSKDITTFTDAAYNSIALDASGLAQINTSGWTKFCLRTTGDINNSTPTGRNGIIYNTYETGVGRRPQLVVTFTAANPIILSVDASNITTEGARLNSLIVNDGSGTMEVENAETRFGYAACATLVNGTGTATGSPISLLPDGVVNNVDVTVLGNFTVTLPTGYTGTATSDVCTVAGSPVALVAGANLITTNTAIGNIKISVVLNDFTALPNIQAWDTNGGLYYHSGDSPYQDLTGLTVGTMYYFCVQVRNSVNPSVTAATERYFTTLISVDDMVSFSGEPKSKSIVLTWLKGVGANRTRIRYKLDTYPTSETGADGSTEVYFNTGTNYTHSGLTAGTTYYYSAWGETGGTYSTNEINLVLTTSSTLTYSKYPAPVLPSGWFQDPDETFLANLQPFYSVINGVADSFQMPRENMWLGVALLFTMFAGIGIYIAFHSASFAMILMGLLIGGFVTLHILPLFMLVFVIGLGFGAWATRPQGV